MPHALGHPYRSPGETEPPRSPSDATSPRFTKLFVAAMALSAVWAGVIGWREHQLDRAIAAMPPALQAQAYRRAHDELTTVCATQRLEAHCSEEAAFIARFPQCDRECRALVRRHLGTATR